MAVSTRCECGKALRVNDKLSGKRIKCPACGRPVRVPDKRGTSPSGSPADATAVAGEGKPVADGPASPSSRRRRWMWAAGAALGAVLLGAGVLFFLNAQNQRRVERLKAELIGKWQQMGSDLPVVEFSNDGTIEVTAGRTNSVRGEYEVLPDGRVRIAGDMGTQMFKATIEMIQTATGQEHELSLMEFEGSRYTAFSQFGEVLYSIPPTSGSMTLRRVR